MAQRSHSPRSAAGPRAAPRGRRLIVEALEPRLVLDALPIINEFLADNKTGLADSNGNRWDWIELYNAGDTAIVLGPHDTTPAWSLECGGDSWNFPSGYTLAAGEFKVIFAAGASPSPAPPEVWADFKLDKDGESLKLVNPTGQVAYEYDPYPSQSADISYGVGQTLVNGALVDSGIYYFATPSPGAANVQSHWAQVADTKFSTDHGFYTSSFPLTISSDTVDATIRYTLNGADPSANGRVKPVAMLTRSGTTATAYCPSHGLSAGNQVQISGAEQTAYNGLFTIVSVPTADTFTFTVSGSPTTPATGVIQTVLYKLRTVSTIAGSGSTATVTTATAHGFATGDFIRIEGANEAAFNGVFPITFVSTTQFTYTVNGTLPLSASGSITADVDNTKKPTLITSNSLAATVTMASHGYASNDLVRISGANEAAYNGYFVITVTSTSQFTFTLSATAAPTATGTITIQSNCFTYDRPFTIGKTSTVRAAAYKKDYASTDVDTQTYLFTTDIVTQSSTGAAPAGWPTGPVNSQTLNYGMDPDIVNSPTWSSYVQDALKSLPTVSLVTPLSNLLNASSGIYVNASQEGEQWERPTSVEWINADGSLGFQVDAGIRIRGGTHGSSTSNPKHAFRLFFKSQYGDAKLEYPLFGDDAADSFDKLDLRCSSNMSWAMEGSSNDAMIRDWFARQTQEDMGDVSTHSQFCLVYINGQFWGLYQVEERPEASFAASYFGGDDSDYDVVKASSSHTVEATDGTLTAWQNLWNMAQSGFASNTTYYHAQGLDPVTLLRDTNYPVYLDVDNLIDYMIGILYTGDRDAPISDMLGNSQINNWYGIWNHARQTGFQFIRHDGEITLSQGATTRNGPYACGYSSFSYSNPQYLHEELMANTEYRVRFADRVQMFLTHSGALTSTGAINRFKAEAEQLWYSTSGGPVVAESARWGDAKVTTPLTKNTWLSAVNNEINSYFPNRTTVLLAQLKATTLPSWRGGASAPLYPSVTAPDFNQYGGSIYPGFALIMTGQGTIYYMLDGTDPRLPGGSIRSGALVYSGAVTLNSSARVMARSYSGGVWSALSDVTFAVDLSSAVRISELMYHPAAATSTEAAAGWTAADFEYIELTNISAQTMPLALLEFTDGVEFTFLTYQPGTSQLLTLAPGQYVVVVANEAAFAERYPNFDGVIAGPYSGSLNDSGENVELDGADGATIQEFTYGDGWYPITDGDGFSLSVRDAIQATTLWDSSDGWRASAAPGGTPGYADILATPGAVLINEVLAHSDETYGDVIELYNTGSTAVDLSGWYLSDDKQNLLKYRIADGTILAAGAYLMRTQADNFGVAAADAGCLVGFGLSEYGDDVYLSSPAVVSRILVAGGYREHVDFGATPNGLSVGVYLKGTGATDFTLLARPTFGTRQDSALSGEPNSDPYVAAVVINEVMYHPASPSTAEEAAGYTTDDFEYVEIYNRSAADVILNGNPYQNLGEDRYTLTGGIGFTFGWLPAELVGGAPTQILSEEAGANATWSAAGLASATYEVYATYKLNDPQGNARNLDDRAQYTIFSATGGTTVTINQDDTFNRQLDADSTLWIDLGTYTFNGTGSIVLIRTAAAGQGDATLAGSIVLRRSGAADTVLTTPTVDSPFLQSGITSIPAGGYVVVASNQAAFNLRYDNSDAHIAVAGSYSRHLGDGGDTVNLDRYEVSDADLLTGFIPSYTLDHVTFGDGLPKWPAEADGDGPSLMRRLDDVYGNESANWAAGDATPAAPNVLLWYHDAPDATHIRLLFSEPLTTASAQTLGNYTLALGTLSSAVLNAAGTMVTLTLSTAMVSGTSYSLSIANLMTLSGRAVPTPVTTNFRYAVADLAPPRALILPAASEVRTAALGSMTITFSEPVSGFALADLCLTRDGGTNLLTGSQTLTSSDSVTWTLGNLASLTATPGSYLLALAAANTSIVDTAGNALLGGATERWVLATQTAVVAGRYIFYNNSAFDGNDSAANASDDTAIATDKTPLLPGGTATFANYTSYVRGINGIIIDIGYRPALLTAADFEFRTGNDNSPSAWALATAPTVSIRWGEGALLADGVTHADRITLTWEDYYVLQSGNWVLNSGGIGQEWLQVTVKANANTGLSQDDVFYFGNAIGETGDSASNAAVNIVDFGGARDNPHNAFNRATITDAYDFDRDQFVNIVDLGLVRDNGTNAFNDLNLITVPANPSPTDAGQGGTIAGGVFAAAVLSAGPTPPLLDTQYALFGAILADGTFPASTTLAATVGVSSNVDTADAAVAAATQPVKAGFAARDAALAATSQWSDGGPEDEILAIGKTNGLAVLSPAKASSRRR